MNYKEKEASFLTRAVTCFFLIIAYTLLFIADFVVDITVGVYYKIFKKTV